ncbi:MAG: glycoside hydrolase family 88 protein [Muribaculaceae bacterium]|nr:glycoside hydrolase family 88 protein [Muribaculaceae bacterium]
MRKKILFLFLVLAGLKMAGETPNYSALMIESHGREWSAEKPWDYVSGLVAKTILMYCQQYPEDELSGEGYEWCKTYADNAIDEEGKFYNFKKGSLDNIASGKVLIDLYTQEVLDNKEEAERYQGAAEYLYHYLRYDYTRITLNEGKDGFIHKDSYPYQMWLDGLYMGAAFYAEYLATFAPDDNEGWSDIALQFRTIHEHTYDPETSLNYHGWSANPGDMNSFWANKNDPYKGCSSEFWGRGMGWYAAALVDVLALMPKQHPDYVAIEEIFHQVADGILRWQDEDSGVWYQLLQYDDSFVSQRGNHNYLEASASSMFTYALFKGMRLGLLDSSKVGYAALKAYEGLLDTFISEKSDGIDINNICRSAGLGPFYNLERNGSADYYLDGSDVNIVSNEGKGIGSFIMASLEYEKYTTASIPSLSSDNAALTAPLIFDLQGRRLEKTPKGLYIEVRDGKATKRLNRD